jgi:hypothetical protein
MPEATVSDNPSPAPGARAHDFDAALDVAINDATAVLARAMPDERPFRESHRDALTALRDALPGMMAERDGPRTYQSAWQWDTEGRPLLMTAEDWLAEEAQVHAAITRDDDEADTPNHGASLLAISREIASLRRDVSLHAANATQNAAEATRLRADLARVTTELDERDADVVKRLRKMAHEAEAGDVAVCADMSEADLASAIRDAMPWMPTALHAIVHGAADRLDRLAASRAEGAALRDDAERWRAFLHAGRVRLLGYAQRGTPWMHVGVELTLGEYPDELLRKDDDSRTVLLDYADAARASRAPDATRGTGDGA